MNLSKKQVKAWLDTMGKDYTRPILCGAYVDTFEDRTVVVATDGYVLAILAADALKDHLGKYIERAEIIKWHKLASARDYLTDEALIELLTDAPGDYPKWQALVSDLKPGAIESITFNEDYISNMCKLADDHLTWNFHGEKSSPLTAAKDGNTYVVMPLKS